MEVKTPKRRGRKRKNSENIEMVEVLQKPKEWTEPPKGEEYSICKKCGNEFQQDYYAEQNIYSNYRTCKECRIKEAREKEKKSNENYSSQKALLDYEPFKAQQKMHDSFEIHRFLLLCCGNRFGKDRFTIMAFIIYFVDCLNENRHIDHTDMVPPVYGWIVAPTERMARQNWKELKKYFPKEWIVAISDSTLVMNTIGGGVIEVRSAYDPEALVGVGLDIVAITEAARIKDLAAVWANLEARLSSPGRGREKDRKGHSYGMGKAIINSSPLGKNYFYTMWTWGQKDHPNYSSMWESFQFSWDENPVNKELANTKILTKYGEMLYSEDLRRRLGNNVYRQNYLGEFLDDEGTVFKNFEEKCVKQLDFKLKAKQKREIIEEWQMAKPYNVYRIGYDPATGGSGDTPAIVIRDKSENRIVKIISLYGKKYDEQWDTISFYSKLYNNAECAYGITGHTAIEGQLAKRGVLEIPLDEHGTKKSEYINNLERAIENNCCQILYDGEEATQTLIYEMNDYSFINGRYKNKEQAHDDFVSAMYFCYFDFDKVEIIIPPIFDISIVDYE